MAAQASPEECRELEPAASAVGPSLHGYFAAVDEALVEESDGQTEIGFLMVRLHPPHTEIAVYGTTTGDQHQIVVREARSPLWVAANNQEPFNLSSNRYEASLDDDTFQSIFQVWSRYVNRIRVPSTSRGMTAPDYYFSALVGGGWFTGRAPGPKTGSCVHDLALLGEALIGYARADPAERKAQVPSLKARLAAAQAHE